MNGADNNSLVIPHLHRVFRIALLIGGVGVVLSLILAWFNPYYFFPAYLEAFLLWFGISLGSVAVLMLYNVVGGRWGDVIRPALETAARGVWLMALLFIPILIGMKWIYPWASEAVRNASDSAELNHQYEHWLKPGLFIPRAIAYFVIWSFLAWVMNRRPQPSAALIASVPHEGHGDRGTDLPTVDHNPAGTEAPSGSGSPFLKAISAPGLPVYCITVSLAAIDWAMSLQPAWTSTIYGFLFIVSQALSTMAFATVVVAALARWTWIGRGRPAHLGLGHQEGSTIAGGAPGHGTNIEPGDLNDLGNLMLTFTILWAYMSFSQFLIQWAGNLPDETQYYRVRLRNGWQYLGLVVLVLHFFLPFFCLLSRDVKRNPRSIGVLAVFILIIRQVDLFWVVAPSAHAGKTLGQAMGFSDLAAVMAVGGIWAAFFAWQHAARARQGISLFPPAAPVEHGDAHGAATGASMTGGAVAHEGLGGASHG